MRKLIHWQGYKKPRAYIAAQGKYNIFYFCGYILLYYYSSRLGHFLPRPLLLGGFDIFTETFTVKRVLCCIVYKSYAQWYVHSRDQFLNFHIFSGFGFIFFTC